MSTTKTTGTTAGPTIERHSIDYIPWSERHGKLWHQAPFWFTGNFVLPTMVIGFLGPELGLSAAVTFLAVLLGACFGTFFMAFHANQGPRMGLPQMIQSRAQFGARGVIVPFLADRVRLHRLHGVRRDPGDPGPRPRAARREVVLVPGAHRRCRS